jgi:hypothetical protein
MEISIPFVDVFAFDDVPIVSVCNVHDLLGSQPEKGRFDLPSSGKG